jgi:hypothetical protein
MPLQAAERSAETLRANLPTEGRSQLRLRFLTDRVDATGESQHVSGRSRARRLLTECRDRPAPVLGAVGGRS